MATATSGPADIQIATSNDLTTPSPVSVSYEQQCRRKLREKNLDSLGFEASAKSNKKTLYVHSPAKIDGSDGRVYVLGSDRLRRRVQQLSKSDEYGIVSPFRKIGLTPPKNPTRRTLELYDTAEELQQVLLYDAADASSKSSFAIIEKPPKPKSRTVYVPMLDPYMLGSTDYSEALEFLQHIVCGREDERGRVCGGRLTDLRIPCGGTGGAFCFKVFCNSCGEEHRWGADFTPKRNKFGRFETTPSTYCNIGDRRLYSVSMIQYGGWMYVYVCTPRERGIFMRMM